MAVPLTFRDAAAMKRLDPWLAIGSFAPIRAKGQPPEARPITFAGNKIVVAERWHPAVPEGAREFSPWDHVDSLVGIELVEAAPYWAQFDVSAEPKVQQGLALVRQTCAFCHGARKIGAKLGWDLVEPYPLYSYRRPDTRLYYHIAYNPWNAAEKGLRMPALKFMTKEDAAAVWQWLKAIAEKPMPAYAPTAQAGRRRP
jgi:mono/diheme cytochrome c family protein